MKRMRSLIVAAAALASSSAYAQYTDGVIKIGVLTDMSSLYSDLAGAGSVAAAKMAVADFNPAAKGMKVEIISGDHQNKPDIASSLANSWFDVDKVDVIVDLVNSGACIIKSPLDLLVGLFREYQIAIPADNTSQYNAWSLLSQRSTSLQQQIMGITLVAGWDAYREAPQYHELWINSVTYSERNFYTDLLIGTGDMMDGTTIRIDAMDLKN